MSHTQTKQYQTINLNVLIKPDFSVRSSELVAKLKIHTSPKDIKIQ